MSTDIKIKSGSRKCSIGKNTNLKSPAETIETIIFFI